MKKVIKLTESDLINMIKRVIKESEVDEAIMSVNPFNLAATSKGNLQITNTQTKKVHYYSMEAWKGVNWWDCEIIDFPEGSKIKLKAVGNYMTIPVDKTQIKNLLQSKFGQKEITTTLKDDKTGKTQEVKFTRVD